jgi:hypothetical protein
MTATRSQGSNAASPNGGPIDPAALRVEIEQTRTDLGHTVEALAAKADVKARAQETVAEMKARARDSMEAAKMRAREGLGQTASNAVYTARELRAHPAQQLQVMVARLRRSFAEHPAPWAVAGGLLALALLVRRWRR